MIILTDAPERARRLVMPGWLEREAMRLLSERLLPRPRIVLTDVIPPLGPGVGQAFADEQIGKTITIGKPARYR